MTTKLYYYQATGRAQQLRLALAAANIPWEDVHAAAFPATPEETKAWQVIGGNTTTNVPMLVHDGKVYTQSSAILRTIGRLGGLMPSSEEELYTTDKLIADAEDLRTEAYKSFVTWGAPQSVADDFVNKVIPLHFGNLERQLKEGGGDYFCGNKLTIADITIFDAVTNFTSDRAPEDVLEGFDVLKAWKERVGKHEGIANFFASEQYTGLYKFDKSTLGY